MTSNLLKCAHAGDQDAVDELFAKHTSMLYRFVRARLDARMRHRLDVSDVVQDTRLTACRRLNEFCERRPMLFSIWLCQSASDRLCDLRRTHLCAKRSVLRKVRPTRETIGEFLQVLEEHLPTPSEQLSGKEKRNQFAEGLRELSTTDQRLLKLRHVEGRSHDKTSQRLDVTAAAVCKRYGRALMRLEKSLTRLGIEDATP